MLESVERIDRLEREMQRLRGWILVLGIALIATFTLGAAQGTPEELTLRRLAIVDGNGRERIVAGTASSGETRLTHYDRGGKMRIAAVTFPTGEASLVHFDRNGQQRIVTGTFGSGEATTFLNDRNGKIRITALTRPDGSAMLGILDSKEQPVWSQVSPK